MEDNKEKLELDLFTLIQKAWDLVCDVFKKIVGFLGYLLQIVYKYKYLYLIFILLAAGYSYRSTRGKAYRGQFTVRVNDGDLYIYRKILESLSHYIEAEDGKGLADALNIPAEKAYKIAFFGWGFDPEAVDSTSTMPKRNRGFIKIGVTDRDAYPELRDVLINHLKNNEHLASFNNARITSLREREQILDKEIAMIDSLQKVEYFHSEANPEIKLHQGQGLRIKTDKQMYYTDKLKLITERDDIRKELQQNPEIITVILDALPTKQPVNTLKGAFKQYVKLALMLSLILSLCWEFRKTIFNYLRGKNNDSY